MKDKQNYVTHINSHLMLTAHTEEWTSVSFFLSKEHTRKRNLIVITSLRIDLEPYRNLFRSKFN